MARNRKALFIEGNRDCYGPDQREDRTMTVAELMGLLRDFDPDSKVFLRNDNGYTYGSISYDDFGEAQYDDDRVYYEGNEGFDEELAYSLISELEEE